MTGGPRSPVFARATGPSRSSSVALSAVASRDELVSRDSPLLLKVHASLEARRCWSWWPVSDHPLTGVSIRCVCSRSPPVFERVLSEGGGGVNSPRSPRLQEVQRPLSGSISTYSKCRLCLDAVYISCYHCWPFRVGAVLLPDGHGMGPLALGHSPCARCWWALRLLSWSGVLDVLLYERVFPVGLCPGGSSQPLRAISRDRAVLTSSGGATASSHLGNSFGFPCSGEPQCEICPFHCSFLPNLRTFPQDARWHPWSVSVFAMGSPLLGSRLFFLSARS